MTTTAASQGKSSLDAASEVSVSVPAVWLSAQHSRWRHPRCPMTAARQKELIQEYIADLPDLPCRRLRTTSCPSQSLLRDQRVRLAPSSALPSLQAVYLCEDGAGRRPFAERARVLDYRGWLLTEAEYLRFGYAVHTAVCLPRRSTSAVRYILLGDPTAPAAQINCVTGTQKRANVQLTVSSTKATDSVDIAVRATKTLRADDELWLDYGRTYWQHMILYCPHCLEYGADEQDQMLLCEADGCKRAWHQLCLSPSPIEVPDGPFFCDLHTKRCAAAAATI